jgi:hypothetical protein
VEKKNTKGTIFIKSTIDLQFETDSAGNCPTVCKLGGMAVGGTWDVFKRVVNLPNPKAKLPYPGTATHQAQSSMSLSAVLHILQHRLMKMDTNSPCMLQH